MIEELSLQNNSLTGAIDFGDGCPLVELSVDCDEVQCACCALYCNSTNEASPDLPPAESSGESTLANRRLELAALAWCNLAWLLYL